MDIAPKASPAVHNHGKENSSTPIDVTEVRLTPDRLKVRLLLNGWRAGCVTSVRIAGVTSGAGQELWHDAFYYSLNQIPD